MMTSKSILCIVEGEVTEIKILHKLNKVYIGKNINFLPIKTNIYHFYQTYSSETEKVGDDIDIFLFLKRFDTKGILAGKEPEDFLGIYLFMDLDRHEPSANQLLNCIPDMLKIFNNHSGNGQLYISYPMSEAFWHAIIDKETSLIDTGKKYKAYVGEHRLKLNHRDDFNQSFIAQIKQMNYLLNDTFNFPQNYQIDDWSQSDIYTNQLCKYIEPNNEVLVLSPFALFLLEYLGKPLFLEWQAFDN